MDAPRTLSSWIRARYPSPGVEALTHLKLQKLAFYCYGAALAFDLTEVGDLRFEAWKHGPVNRPIWKLFRDSGALPLPPLSNDDEDVRYSKTTETILGDVLTIYGTLSAWGLRQQSHREQPWIAAIEQQTEIARPVIQEHFKAKWCSPTGVAAPEYLADAGSLRLDGINPRLFENLGALARVVRNAHAHV